jgi:hypothetical protein
MRGRAVLFLSAAALVASEAPALAQSPAPAPTSSVGAEGRKEVTGSTSTLETAPSPVQAGTSVAAPGLPPLPPPYPETTEPVDPGKVETTAPAAAEKKDPKTLRKRHERAPSAALEQWLAFRYTWYRLSGSDRDGSSDSFQASFAYDSSSTLLGAATKFNLNGAIGSGAGHPDGTIEGALLAGLRTNPRGTQGILGRIGIAGSYSANANWLRSWLELPRGEVGYQLLGREAAIELTAHGGASLTGRFDPGATLYRATPVSFAWGGSGMVQLDPIRLAVDYTRTEAAGPTFTTPLDEMTGRLCVEPFSSILACGEAAQSWGDVQDASGAAYTVKALRIGFSIGFGHLSHRSAVQKLEPEPPKEKDDDD